MYVRKHVPMFACMRQLMSVSTMCAITTKQNLFQNFHALNTKETKNRGYLFSLNILSLLFFPSPFHLLAAYVSITIDSAGRTGTAGGGHNRLSIYLSLVGAATSVILVEKTKTKTRFLTRQKYACRDKSMLVATKLLSPQNFCRDKYLSRKI